MREYTLKDTQESRSQARVSSASEAARRKMWSTDLKVGLLPHTSFLEHFILPTYSFQLSPPLKPILGLGLPQNNLGTLALAKDGEHGHKSCKVIASWQAFCCRKTVFHCTSSLISIWICCSVSRANSRLLGLKHYCQI